MSDIDSGNWRTMAAEDINEKTNTYSHIKHKHKHTLIEIYILISISIYQ